MLIKIYDYLFLSEGYIKEELWLIYEQLCQIDYKCNVKDYFLVKNRFSFKEFIYNPHKIYNKLFQFTYEENNKVFDWHPS